MIYFAYRYEDSEGFGPFYNERKKLYNWKDDGWRYACDSIEKLNEWWFNNREEMHLENYHIVKYTLDLSNIFRILKVKETHMIDFKLSEVVNKEDFES